MSTPQSRPADAALSAVLAVLDARAVLAPGALARAKAAGGRADRMLIDLGLVAEEDMADAYAQALGLQYKVFRKVFRGQVL